MGIVQIERSACVILFFIFLALFCYLFLICPHIGKNPMRDPVLQVPYAHQGLHGESILPNSPEAYERAAEQGYGIELDVHLSKDHQPVIIHDSTLEFLYGIPKRVQDLTLDEMHALGVYLPTLPEILAQIHGRVPLMIEIKPVRAGVNASILPKKVLACLEHYNGPVCIASFDPRPLFYFRMHAPRIARGQLSGGCSSFANCVLAYQLCNFLSRPHFLSCRQDCRTLSFKIARLFHPVTCAWTIRSTAEWQAVQPYFDLMVFEAFLPPAGCTARPFQKEGN